MRCCLLALALFAAAAIAAEQPGKQSENAQSSGGADLSGVWKGFVVEGKGEQPDRGPTHLELTIKDNHIVGKRLDGGGQALGEGLYKIIPGRPAQMNAAQVVTRGKPRIYLGICTLEADQIKWCVATPGSRRPASFETKGQQFLVILKRQKTP